MKGIVNVGEHQLKRFEGSQQKVLSHFFKSLGGSDISCANHCVNEVEKGGEETQNETIRSSK